MYNILIGGEAGQGIDTATAILEKILKRAGYGVFTMRDFMSRIRGGHNFSLIRFGTEAVCSHSYLLDGIVAFSEETVELHKEKLKKDGFILCDSKLNINDNRAVMIPMDDIAKSLGNMRVVGSIAIGAVLKFFSIKQDNIQEILHTFIDEKYIEINLKAVEKGYLNADKRYTQPEGKFSGNMIITGSQALALGAIAGGLRFYSAYPMSPSTPILVYLASKSAEAEIVVEQAEDEIAAINMCLGASFAGARAMTGTSGGGFSLMVEALGLSGIAEIPLVVVNVQRPGPATGLPTRTEQGDLKFMISAAQGEFPRMVIAPRNHSEAFYQTARALNIAEKYQIPVILLLDQYLGDSSAAVEPFEISAVENVESVTETENGEYLRYRFTESGISPRLIPGKTKKLVAIDSDEHDEEGRITESAEVRTMMADKRMRKLKSLESELQEPEFIGADGFDTLLIGWGSMQGPLEEAILLLNRKTNGRYAALVFGDIFPLPKRLLMEKAKKAENIINVEQNATGQIAGIIREYTGIVCTGGVLKYDGRQLSGEEIAEAVMREERMNG